jgi:arylsulfatase A-like enzyme
MMRRAFLVIRLLTLLGVRLTAAASNANNDSERQSTIKSPNLLFIITDQQRYDMLGVMQERLQRYRGHLQIQTPNMDAMAKHGVLFETSTYRTFVVYMLCVWERVCACV